MKISSGQFKALIELAIEASNNTLIYHRSPSLKIELKDDQSPLTIADQTTNTIICTGLKTLFPEIPIISEEESNETFSVRKDYNLVWLVDPLDGTKEFIKGGDDYTVNIGLVYNGRPIFGLVSQPVKRVLFFGWTDPMVVDEHQTGSYKIDYGHDVQRTDRLICQKPVGILRIVCSKSHLNKETENFLACCPDHESVNIGSSLKIIMVADNGKADLYPRLGSTWEWDTAAAHAVLSGAGGLLMRLNIDCDRYTLDQFSYNKKDLLNPYFICGHPELLCSSLLNKILNK